MWYALAADFIALLHLAFIVFVVFGALLGRCHRGWLLAHLAAMTYGVLIEVFYWYCPLTYAEQYLRERAGAGVYTEPFIAHYLNKIIYLNVSQGMLILAAIVVLGVNSVIYFYSWRAAKPLRN